MLTSVAATKHGHGAEESEPCPRSALLDHSRRHRTAFTREQLSRLEQEYCKESYVSRPRRCELATELALPETTIKVWFQNRRMKDKRQRHSLTWPHPLVDPLGMLLLGRAAAATAAPPSASSMASPSPPYPFIPHHLPHHLPLHLYSPLALSSSAHSPYSVPVRPLEALRLTHYHGRAGTLQPPGGALYPALGGPHHPASCNCPLCVQWGADQLFKARGEIAALGMMSRPRSPGAIQSAALDRREEVA